MIDFNERTKLAIELAKLAGKEIKRIRDEEDIQTKGKGLNDVVTIADIESEKIIVNKIREVFPNDTIIAEEKVLMMVEIVNILGLLIRLMEQ